MVNQILEKENVTTEWLKHKQRSRVEGQLGCLANLLKQKNDPSRDTNGSSSAATSGAPAR